MRKILKIETIEPLVLRSDTSTLNYTSLSYIPGTVIRGAFANRYISKYGVDDNFQKIFLDGNILFKNAYPISSLYGENVISSNPFPKTAYSCKRCPGFQRDETKTKQTHGVYDMIFLRAFSKRVPKCPKCGEPLKGMRGFYNLLNDGTYASSGIDESKTLFTHTAIRYNTGTAKSGQLYNEEAISEDRLFRGSLIVKEEVYIQFLSELLNENENTVYLGRGRTRGYGKVKVEYEDIAESRSNEEFTERLKKFDKLAKKLGGNEEKFYFSIDLVSDIIILDDYLRYKKFIDEKYISSLLNTNCRELYSASNTGEVIGWNAAWNLPKPKHIAIEKGSVFFFEAPESEENNLLKKLFDLENNGIGIMREEGFGFISISDKFHIGNSFKEGKDE